MSCRGGLLLYPSCRSLDWTIFTLDYGGIWGNRTLLRGEAINNYLNKRGGVRVGVGEEYVGWGGGGVTPLILRPNPLSWTF
jgi:hypothetical protein